MSDNAIGRPKLQMLTVDPSAIRTSSASSSAEHRADAVPTYAESFESVFRKDYASVARMAYLLLGATGEAEEVTQEAFATLLQRWDRVENPSGFVRTAVLNRCRDLGRRRSVRHRALQRLRPASEPVVSDGSGDLEVLEALMALDLQLREVIVLRYYLDHTVDHIAELTDVPAGTVKSRLHRAHARLSEALAEQ